MCSSAPTEGCHRMALAAFGLTFLMMMHHTTAEGNLRGREDTIQSEMGDAVDKLSEARFLNSIQVESFLDGDVFLETIPADNEDPLAALDNAEYSPEFDDLKRIVGGSLVTPGKWLDLGMTMMRGINGNYYRG